MIDLPSMPANNLEQVPDLTEARATIDPHRPMQVAIAFVTLGLGAAAALWLGWRYGISWIEVALLVVMYSISAAGSEVGFHRHFAHRAFKTYPWMTQLLGIAGTMAGQGHVVFWTATHRIHHKHADRPGDPHSPHYVGERATGGFKGWWSSYVGWVFRYDLEPQWPVVAPDLYRNPAIASIVRHEIFWMVVGLLAPACAGSLLHGGTVWGFVMGLLWGGVLRLFLFQQAMLFANSLCHIVGPRPFVSPDHSANTIGLAIPTFGGALHNNHHAFPASPRTGFNWWEVDLAGSIIDVMAAVGLAWDLQKPSAEALGRKRRSA
jgi:stearoyl-CoA desaturase (delta-9 desaturase)